MVFHTAPPQPASNARMTWSAVLVGGPDASQNGLGDSMPANDTLRSATASLQNRVNPARGALALGHRVHHFGAPAFAIAARKIERVRRLQRLRIDAQAGPLALEMGNEGEQRLLRPLTGRAHDRVDREHELA